MNKTLTKHTFFIEKQYGRGVFDNHTKQWAIDNVKEYIFKHEPSIARRQEFATARIKLEQASDSKFDVYDYLLLAIDLGLLK